MIPTATYGVLHLGSSQVPIWNMSAHPIKVPVKAHVGKVAPANQVAPAVLPTETSGRSTCSPQKGWILEALDLQGLEDLPEAEL